MLGNAVPSLLAEILAREIRKQLLGSGTRSSLKLSVRRRSNPPKPERVGRTPRSYFTLVKNYRRHPGTGKGRGALRRKRDDEKARAAA